jgi:hypothetical protein
METLASSEVFLFEDFRLDRRGRSLLRRGENGAFTSLKQSYDIAAGIDCDPPGATRMLMTKGLQANAA